MPKKAQRNSKDRNKTERLPKSERREVSGKVVVLNTSSSSSSLTSPISSLSLRSVVPPRSATSSSPLPLALRLPGDVLRRIFKFAGHLSMVTALRVAAPWRLIGLELLSATAYIDVGALFRHVRTVDLTYPMVHHSLNAFPALKSLDLSGWTPGLHLPEVAASVMLQYASYVLEEVDLSGHTFESTQLVTLVAHCPALRTVRMQFCDCVDDRMIARLVVTRQSMVREGNSPPFELIDLTDCRSLTRAAVLYLAQSGIVADLVATKSETIIGYLDVVKSSLRCMNLSNGSRLTRVSIGVRNASLQSLNLSLCKSLEDLSIYNLASAGATPTHALTDLNLSGAARLVDIEFGMAVGEADDAGNPTSPLPELQRLSLFGARTLSPRFFASTLGLSGLAGNTVLMPKLRSLNLNGCRRLDRLSLVNYLELEAVDCCGCPVLESVTVRNAPALRQFKIRGKWAPLRQVDITAPPEAEIDGIRQAWTVERCRTSIRVTYVAGMTA